MPDANGLPAPTPGDTARLDQHAARVRDMDPAALREIADAARALLAGTSQEGVAQLFNALRSAGLHDGDGR
ncbi:hypothetical protein [Streptomyces sp. NPDC059783]|uniref:hypothetical protein n=1 Tax=Streptomyces sp. NPDC059783 TaxID=3346944 RepID=UPI003657809E